METHVFLAVLAAAAMHAGWNAILKIKLEPLLAITYISIASGLVLLPALPVVNVPQPRAWPYIAASLAIHIGYYLALSEAYRSGDLGQVYPIARGSAPLMTAVGALVLVGERLGAAGWTGIVLLGFGIILLSLKGGRDAKRIDGRSVGFALLTAATISAYTLVDGMGARLSEDAFAYIVWLIVADGAMMLVFGLVRWPRTLIRDLRGAWPIVLAGGALSSVAYAIAIWAMSKAPIALVAALRETSVLFAALIGVVFLREPLLPARITAALLVVAGIVLLRLR